MSMNFYREENQPRQMPKWSQPSLALVSAILGVGVLWFVWFRYSGISNRPEISLYHWIQLVSIALIGILCLSAAILFIAGKPFGWSVLKAGLSIVPLLLFSNLVVLLLRVSQNVMQGHGISLLSRLYASPLNKAIVGVVILLILLSVIKDVRKS
jgi:hypothetical protein